VTVESEKDTVTVTATAIKNIEPVDPLDSKDENNKQLLLKGLRLSASSNYNQYRQITIAPRNIIAKYFGHVFLETILLTMPLLE